MASGRSARKFLPLVLVGIILALLYAAAIPNFIHRGYSPANACINNLRQIDGAVQEFALEHGKTNGDAINYPEDIMSYMRVPSGENIPPKCPSGGTYHISKVGEFPTCSLGTNVTPAHVLK